MAKWIVQATPLRELEMERGINATAFLPSDRAAKDYIRDAAQKHFVVRLSSAPDVKPAVYMDHGDALRWAHS
jgi:hypothetical protein